MMKLPEAPPVAGNVITSRPRRTLTPATERAIAETLAGEIVAVVVFSAFMLVMELNGAPWFVQLGCALFVVGCYGAALLRGRRARSLVRHGVVTTAREIARKCKKVDGDITYIVTFEYGAGRRHVTRTSDPRCGGSEPILYDPRRPSRAMLARDVGISIVGDDIVPREEPWCATTVLAVISAALVVALVIASIAY